MEVVIVSNARTEQHRQLTLRAVETSGVRCVVVEQQPDVDYCCDTVHYSFPFNYNKCLNLGFEYTTHDVVGFFNNDVEFIRPWIECEKFLKDFGSISLLNPGWGFHKQFIGKPINVGYRIGLELCGWGIVTTRETMKTIGGFDDDVEFWCSDNIYAEQLKKAKIRHALITDYSVKHVASKTLTGTPSKLFGQYTHGQAAKFAAAKKKYQ